MAKIMAAPTSRALVYRSWYQAKLRCYSKKHHKYKDYGARGITMCPEWLESFDTFLNDMGYKPNKNMVLDRIDNDGAYCKTNCRWTDHSTSSFNKRIKSDNTSGYRGVSFHPTWGLWQVRVRLNKKSKTIGYFRTKEAGAAARRKWFSDMRMNVPT